MAEIRKSTWYEARMTEGSGRLADTWETLKEAKAGIDKANKRTAAKGYKPSQYLITKTDAETKYTNAGKFMERIVTETAIQTYPKEIKK